MRRTITGKENKQWKFTLTSKNGRDALFTPEGNAFGKNGKITAYSKKIEGKRRKIGSRPGSLTITITKFLKPKSIKE